MFMKRKVFVSVLFLLVSMFVCLPVVSANYLNVGDSVVINQGTESAGDGGAFYVTDGSFTFKTFCESDYQFFQPGGTYVVSSITTDIAPGNAYLMTLYWNGTLPGYNYGTPGAGAALQEAVWYLAWLNGTPAVGGPQGQDNSYVTLAQNAIASGAWSGIGDVRGFDYPFNYPPQTWNYGQGQPMYTLVPEPATMLLLGLGLLGLAGIRRKFKK
jgi:hypothetical protein